MLTLNLNDHFQARTFLYDVTLASQEQSLFIWMNQEFEVFA